MKKLRENQKYQRKQHKTPTTFGKTNKNNVFKGLRPTLGYRFLLVFPKVFTKPKKHSRTPNIQNKTKENQTNLRENQNNKVFKGFRPTLGYGFVCFCFVCFPEGFYKTKKHSRKPKILKKTKEHTTKPLGKYKKNNKFLKVSNPPLDMGLFLLFCWFSRRFLQNQKNIRASRRFQTHPWIWVLFLCFFGFPDGFRPTLGLWVWFCFVFFGFLWYLWFSLMFFGFLKTFGKTKKQTRPNPYPNTRSTGTERARGKQSGRGGQREKTGRKRRHKENRD